MLGVISQRVTSHSCTRLSYIRRRDAIFASGPSRNSEPFKRRVVLSSKVTDITKDNVLLERYYLSIPVVELDGDIIFQASDINMPRDIEQKLETILISLI